MSKHIVILSGDGIGPEIMAEAEKVLAKVNQQFNLDLTWSHELLGGCAIDATGVPLPDQT
jgi:3-isopropylmalate dehydrogenase